MPQFQFAIVIAALVLPITGIAVCGLAMLERIEKHLRDQHVRALGPLVERTAEEREIRRRELGLDDGYPYKQTRQVLWSFGSTLVIIYIGTKYWPW